MSNTPNSVICGMSASTAQVTGVVRSTFVIQVQNMPFERNPCIEADLGDVLEGLFNLPIEYSYTDGMPSPPSIPAHFLSQYHHREPMFVDFFSEEEEEVFEIGDFYQLLSQRWVVEVMSQQEAYVQICVRPPIGLGPRAHKFFSEGCGVSSATKMKGSKRNKKGGATAAAAATGPSAQPAKFANDKVGEECPRPSTTRPPSPVSPGPAPAIVSSLPFQKPLILMDRHRFYIPPNFVENNEAIFQYSEVVRKMTQSERHLYTDRLPSRPLKIKLESYSKGVDFDDVV